MTSSGGRLGGQERAKGPISGIGDKVQRRDTQASSHEWCRRLIISVRGTSWALQALPWCPGRPRGPGKVTLTFQRHAILDAGKKKKKKTGPLQVEMDFCQGSDRPRPWRDSPPRPAFGWGFLCSDRPGWLLSSLSVGPAVPASPERARPSLGPVSPPSSHEVLRCLRSLGLPLPDLCPCSCPARHCSPLFWSLDSPGLASALLPRWALSPLRPSPTEAAGPPNSPAGNTSRDAWGL